MAAIMTKFDLISSTVIFEIVFIFLMSLITMANSHF